VFGRFPYWGWLILAILCWAFTGLRHYQHLQMARPAAMAEVVSEDLQEREEALNATLGIPGLIERMFSGTLSVEEVNDLAEAPFYIYAFEQDSVEGNILIFWNSNEVVGVCDQSALSKDDYTLFRNNGFYLKRCIRLSNMESFQTLVVLYPITFSYPLQNEYLRSSFAAAEYIPSSTQIGEIPSANSHAVKAKDGHPLFYLEFKAGDAPKWISDVFMIAALLAALLFTITFLHLIAIWLANNRSKALGLLVIIAFVGLSLSAIYIFGVPFHLQELPIFSTQLYSASSFFPSLGIMLLDMLGVLWIMIFLLSFYNEETQRTGGPISRVLYLVYPVMLIVCTLIPLYMLRSLVIDSKISFDVSSFYASNFYTVVGLLTIALIAGNAAAFIFWVNSRYNKLCAFRIKYLSVAVVGLLALKLPTQEGVPPHYAIGWAILFLIFLDLRRFIKDKGLFGSEMIFWSFFIALSATIAIQRFNEVKEGYKRKLFAENIVRQRDDVMEFLFADMADSISNNINLRAFTLMPSQEARTIVEENLVTTYLRSFNRYEMLFYIFDKDGRPLFNTDTLDVGYFFRITDNALPAGKCLYFRENARDAHYYLAAIPVRDSLQLYGYVFIDMTLKKAANATVYPELLQSARLRQIQNDNNYIYAIYSGRELITQVSDHPFPLYRRRDTLDEGSMRTIEADGYDVVQYKVDPEKTVSIVISKASLTSYLALFSYILGALMIFGAVAAAFRLYFYYILRKDSNERLFRPTIRKRIHLAMLGIVFISFLIIGVVTIWVFVDRYNESNKNKLRAAIKRIERSIQQELEKRNANTDAFAFSSVADEPWFRRYIHELANSHSIDINIYNALGALTTTSQDEIYNKLILARLMMPDPYYQLSSQNRVLLIEDEQIGKLRYLSGYVPLRNERGDAIGYINVPYFSSQKELNYQISNILVALINFYALVFLISSFFALIITNWLTRGLQMIIDRFEKFNLQQNEPLVWEHDDEIGLLVRAYNNMVEKVEESTSLLAQSERESAWREMARQVAHEIKNPLTPMKLNIQYLQQALRNNHPNIQQLTENVSASLIEQIDNLSHIASAFSDFAKMPEAQPEEIELNELLFKAAEIYVNSSRIDVSFEAFEKPLKVYADRSQLLRVITNLIQNAVEAIPDDRDGRITVRLREEEGNALIEVEDNGSGIAQEVIDKMFSPYFTTKGSGTGLGLAMTKRIIEFWKGKIWFETSASEGTTFYVKLPVLENEVAA